MEYRQLGHSGLQVSCVGLGTNSFGDMLNEEQSAVVVRRAIDLGVNYLDTSNSYGNGLSEEYIGRAVKGMRDCVLIATKFVRLGHIPPRPPAVPDQAGGGRLPAGRDTGGREEPETPGYGLR